MTDQNRGKCVKSWTRMEKTLLSDHETMQSIQKMEKLLQIGSGEVKQREPVGPLAACAQQSRICVILNIN